MTIAFLEEIERSLDRGKEVYGCSTGVSGKWEISSSLETIRKIARRAAASKKAAVAIMRLVPSHALTPGSQILIATKIGEDDGRGNSNVMWSTVETKEAAETLRDVSHGPSPFFALETEEEITP